MTIAEAKKNLEELVEKVCSEGISIELERDNRVVARLTPATPRSPLTVGEFNSFLQGLPRLGDDADAFTKDVKDCLRQLR